MTGLQKQWLKQGRSFIMTANEQALLAQMQDLGDSHGLCITALQILSQDKLAVSDMLAFFYDEQPSEEDFIPHSVNEVSWHGTTVTSLQAR